VTPTVARNDPTAIVQRRERESRSLGPGERIWKVTTFDATGIIRQGTNYRTERALKGSFKLERSQ